MILVLIGVCVVLAIIGLLVCSMSHTDASEIVGPGLAGLGFIGFLISLFVTIFLIFLVSKIPTLDERIAMYQEENAKIEAQISEVVERYMEYESDTFETAASDSAIVLTSLYPELKADTLVQSQIDVYIRNNNQIRELKESKIGSSIARWWLYFGK